jgi:K+-sensing histidine kinase KdpD
MHPKLRRHLFAYGVAVASVAAAVLLASLRLRSDRELMFPLSFAAVLASAWYGGLGPGLFATLLAGVAAAYFVMPPRYSFSVADPRQLVHLGLFTLGALVIGSLNERLRAAHRQLDERFREQR